MVPFTVIWLLTKSGATKFEPTNRMVCPVQADDNVDPPPCGWAYEIVEGAGAANTLLLQIQKSRIIMSRYLFFINSFTVFGIYNF